MGLTGGSFYQRRRASDEAENLLFMRSSSGQSNATSATVTTSEAHPTSDNPEYQRPGPAPTPEAASTHGIMSHPKKKARRRRRHTESTSFAEEIESFSFEPSKRPRTAPSNNEAPCTAASLTPRLSATPADTDFPPMVTPAVSCYASVDSGVVEQAQRRKAHVNPAANPTGNIPAESCKLKAAPLIEKNKGSHGRGLQGTHLLAHQHRQHLLLATLPLSRAVKT
jgi:hypothetical protein